MACSPVGSHLILAVFYCSGWKIEDNKASLVKHIQCSLNDGESRLEEERSECVRHKKAARDKDQFSERILPVHNLVSICCLCHLGEVKAFTDVFVHPGDLISNTAMCNNLPISV